MSDQSDQSDQDAQAELAALLASLEAERPAFEAWLAEQTAQAQRKLDELLAALAADTTLDALLAALEVPDVGQTQAAQRASGNTTTSRARA